MSTAPFSYSRVGRSRPGALVALVAAAGLVTAFSAPVAAASTATTGSPAAAAAHGLPYENARLPITKRVADLLGRMTLAEKVGQMTQTERARVYDDTALITTWNLGSILSGGVVLPPVHLLPAGRPLGSHLRGLW